MNTEAPGIYYGGLPFWISLVFYLKSLVHVVGIVIFALSISISDGDFFFFFLGKVSSM